VIVVNADRGHVQHVFVLLDDNVTDAKQTFWRYDYSPNPYSGMNRKDLKKIMDERIKTNGYDFETQIRVRTRFAPPAQRNFSIRGHKIPCNFVD